MLVYATLSPYFDTVRVDIDGKATGATLDAYAPQVLPSGPIELASGLELTKGQHRVRFTVIGTKQFFYLEHAAHAALFRTSPSRFQPNSSSARCWAETRICRALE